MQIIIKSRHVVLPKRLREFATTKFEHLEKLLDRIQSIEIAVGESGARKVADKSVVEVTLVTKMRRLHAEAHGPDIMTAVESAVAKVESQVRKLKGKAMARTRRSGGHVVADRVAAVAALNGSADAPARIASKANTGAKTKSRKPTPKAMPRKAATKKKAVAASGASKRATAKGEGAASGRKTASTTSRASARKSPAKRAGVGSRGR